MRTVKQVSDLTGISVRMLHYYDEIGLLKPSAVTQAGYRLYDDKSLVVLQQILFFKEPDIPLKEFDMTEYYNVLEEFKTEHEDKVIRMYGSVDKYNEFIEKCKLKKAEIAEDGVRQYGSIEKFK